MKQRKTSFIKRNAENESSGIVPDDSKDETTGTVPIVSHWIVFRALRTPPYEIYG